MSTTIEQINELLTKTGKPMWILSTHGYNIVIPTISSEWGRHGPLWAILTIGTVPYHLLHITISDKKKLN